MSGYGPEAWQYKAFKRLNDHIGQGPGNRSVVVKSCGPCFFQDQDNGVGFEAGRYVTCL